MSQIKKISKILIANRSEVALRVQATCHARGKQTVAIFCPEDRHLSYVYQAHEAYPLSKSGYAAYLAQAEILEIAQKSGAQAIHPGYGFLSENATFAQAVIDAGLIWIGPSPSCIARMADKIIARDLMQKAGVAVVPGFFVSDFSDAGRHEALEQANELGYPLIIKDPRSGGGKAMRKVMQVQEFEHAFRAVVSEAQKYTGSTQLLIEKYVQQGRHIEVQVAGDGKNFVHLFERECTIQRRHQKIIEETPCNFVSKQTLEKMYAAALLAAQAVAYDSIGTVEFIVTPDEQFYFLEMNTRLQVEHAVTEMTTGIDLVGLQLDLAQDRQLPLTQPEIIQRGHAIQCRLYAEDPANNFAPATGTLQTLIIPHHPFIRSEHNLHQGLEITPFFDPMIGRFIARGATRALAAANMHTFLGMLQLEGVITNKNFLRAIMAQAFFAQGAFHTQLLANPDVIEVVLNSQRDQAGEHDYLLAGVAVMLFEQYAAQKQQQASPERGTRRWKDQQWR